VGVAHYDASCFGPEERRRLYEALRLKIVVSRNGDIEVRGDLDRTAFPSQEKAYELVAGMVGLPEHRPQKDSLAAVIGRTLAGNPRANIMSTRSTST
jgi:hypothetical protein